MTTAHDLAADTSNWGEFEFFMVKGGHVVWQAASYSERGSQKRVVITRLEEGENGLKLTERWVRPDTVVILCDEQGRNEDDLQDLAERAESRRDRF